MYIPRFNICSQIFVAHEVFRTVLHLSGVARASAEVVCNGWSGVQGMPMYTYTYIYIYIKLVPVQANANAGVTLTWATDIAKTLGPLDLAVLLDKSCWPTLQGGRWHREWPCG